MRGRCQSCSPLVWRLSHSQPPCHQNPNKQQCSTESLTPFDTAGAKHELRTGLQAESHDWAHRQMTTHSGQIITEIRCPPVLVKVYCVSDLIKNDSLLFLSFFHNTLKELPLCSWKLQLQQWVLLFVPQPGFSLDDKAVVTFFPQWF